MTELIQFPDRKGQQFSIRIYNRHQEQIEQIQRASGASRNLVIDCLLERALSPLQNEIHVPCGCCNGTGVLEDLDGRECACMTCNGSGRGVTI